MHQEIVLAGRNDASDANPGQYPKEVSELFRREREIATIVYDSGLATARDVEETLGHSLRNAAIRSMLSRLVRKGILTQVKCGYRGTFVYGPAITQTSAREAALKQFAEDFYGGSLRTLADAIATLFISSRSDGAAGLPAPASVRAARKAVAAAN